MLDKQSEPFGIRAKIFWDVSETQMVTKLYSWKHPAPSSPHSQTSPLWTGLGMKLTGLLHVLINHFPIKPLYTFFELHRSQVLEKFIPQIAHENDGLVFSPTADVSHQLGVWDSQQLKGHFSIPSFCLCDTRAFPSPSTHIHLHAHTHTFISFLLPTPCGPPPPPHYTLHTHSPIYPANAMNCSSGSQLIWTLLTLDWASWRWTSQGNNTPTVSWLLCCVWFVDLCGLPVGNYQRG